jgi:hypothetical protein
VHPDQPAALRRPVRQLSVPQGNLHNIPVFSLADLTDPQRILLLDIGSNLIINLQKDRRIPWIHGKSDDITYIRYNTVCKKGHLRIAESVRYPLPLQLIHKRQYILMIPVQHRRLCLASLRHPDQIIVLCLSIVQWNLRDLLTGSSGRFHMFLVAQDVFLNESVRRLHDLRTGAKVFLHKQYPGPWMILLK